MQNTTLSPIRTYVDFLITAKCNLSCPKCYNPYRSNDEPSLEKISELAISLNKLQIPMITITGGEPLVRDDIDKVMQIFDSYNIKINLNTNGILLMDKWNSISPYIHMLSITLDGSNNEINKITTDSSQHFDKVIEFMQFAKKQKVKVKIKIGTCINRLNSHDMIKLGDLLNKYDSIVNVWRLYQYVPRGIGLKNRDMLEISEELYHEIVNDLKTTYPNISISSSSFNDNSNGFLLIGPKFEVFATKDEGFDHIGIFNGNNLYELINSQKSVDVLNKSADTRKFLRILEDLY